MIEQVRTFIRDFNAKHGPFNNVLDVGALDVNGNVRETFKDASYVGLDMRDGPNVDVVLNGHELSTRWPEPHFDLVLCCDTLEHDNMFWLTVAEMRKVLKPGGWMLITVPSLWHGKHDHPSDYYRFFETALNDAFFEAYEDVVTEVGCWSSGANGERPDEIFGYGRKPLHHV